MAVVPIGAKGRFTLVVGPEHLASQVKDPMLPPVLATPVMILAMENAALNAIRGHLEKGQTALGTMVDVRHRAATPLGKQVTAEAVVTAVDNRWLIFEVSARDEIEEIGRGTHERMLVDLHQFGQRLKAKAQRPPNRRNQTTG